MPAPIGPIVTQEAHRLALAVAQALGTIGVLTVEFFLTADGNLLVNEIAPRPHNSGHLTIEAAVSSQFEQQVRALCGLPLGDTHLNLPAAMVNLLGDLWSDGPPDWDAALRSDPGIKLHLYGKRTPAPGRKMGHMTVLDPDPAVALTRALAARRALLGRRSSGDQGGVIGVRLAEPGWLFLLALVPLLWLWERSRPRLGWPTLAGFPRGHRAGLAWLGPLPMVLRTSGHCVSWSWPWRVRRSSEGGPGSRGAGWRSSRRSTRARA